MPDSDELTRMRIALEKMDERMDRWEAQWPALLQRLEAADKRSQRNDDALRGRDGKNGVLSRIRVLEESKARTEWTARALIGGVIGALASALGALWSALTR